MSFFKASVWTATATVSKILTGLLVVKCFAVSYGPEGMGLASNYRQLITVLGVLAGAGIFNGVTRLIAEHQTDPHQLALITRTSSSLVLICNLLLAAVLFFGAVPFSRLLFNTDKFSLVLQIVGLLQMAIGWANLLQAQLKGFRDAAGNALVVSIGAIVGVIAYVVCWWRFDFNGALTGFALLPASALLPAILLISYRTPLKVSWYLPGYHAIYAKQLASYMIMAVVTAFTLPVAWMIMRYWLAQQSNWQQVGLWQALSSISDVYLQFITATFSVWLLPTLARLSTRQQIASEIQCTLQRILPLLILISLVIWLLRDWVITLLFSAQFHAMRDLFLWQLPGDICKVCAYIFGYVVIARGSLRFYLLAEVSQLGLLLGSSAWFIPHYGITGAVQAYCLTYVCYLMVCIIIFVCWCRK